MILNYASEGKCHYVLTYFVQLSKNQLLLLNIKYVHIILPYLYIS